MKQIICVFILLSFISIISYSQDKKGWTKNELQFYQTMEGFIKYLTTSTNVSINHDSLFKKYIYFDYILKDDSTARVEKRVKVLDTLLFAVRNYIDSVGLNNLDLAPVQRYKNTNEFYKPFEDDLKSTIPNVMAYFDKRNPNKPLGCLLFDDHSFRLVSWVVINQGGTYYFLTFNML